MLPVEMVCDMVCDPREPPWMPEGTPADPRGPPMLPVEMVCDMVCAPRGPPRAPADPRGDPRGPPRTPGDPRGDPEASRQDGLRAASEEGMQENAGLHQGQRAGVQRDVREWGRLRSHPKEAGVQRDVREWGRLR